MSFGVVDEGPPSHFELVAGAAAMTADDPDLLRWTTRIREHYISVKLVESYGRRNAVPSDLLVRVTPDKIVARKNIADRGRSPA